MPRGNDSDAAVHELADRFGQGVGNAELLIDANLATNTQELRAAQLLPIDHEATAEAMKKISKYSGPNGEDVVSLAVRGAPSSPKRYTVIVFETEDGRQHVAALDDKDKPIVPGYLQEREMTDPQGATASRPVETTDAANKRKSGGTSD